MNTPQFVVESIHRRLDEEGFTLRESRCLIPPDDSTLFVIAGMQPHRARFSEMDGGTDATLQSCLRVNDIDLVGDGTHLTYFVMAGNFSFGGPPYGVSASAWSQVLKDLGLMAGCVVHAHPSRADHRAVWESLGYPVVNDDDCMWSDGIIGGHCCEVYYNGVEVGNLVNPMGHSTDVGFGFERLVQMASGKARVDETDLFDQSLPPVARDHVRALTALCENGVAPGNKGRNYVCRLLLRRAMRDSVDLPGFGEWVKAERKLLDARLVTARKAWRRNRDKPAPWWWDTFGILPEEIPLLHE